MPIRFRAHGPDAVVSAGGGTRSDPNDCRLASSAAPEAVLALRIRGRLAQPEAQSATNGAVSQPATLYYRLRFASVSGSPHSRLGLRTVRARMASYSSYSHQNNRPRAGSRPSCRMASAEPFKRVVGMSRSMKRAGANAG